MGVNPHNPNGAEYLWLDVLTKDSIQRLDELVKNDAKNRTLTLGTAKSVANALEDTVNHTDSNYSILVPSSAHSMNLAHIRSVVSREPKYHYDFSDKSRPSVTDAVEQINHKKRCCEGDG